VRSGWSYGQIAAVDGQVQKIRQSMLESRIAKFFLLLVIRLLNLRRPVNKAADHAKPAKERQPVRHQFGLGANQGAALRKDIGRFDQRDLAINRSRAATGLLSKRQVWQGLGHHIAQSACQQF